MVVSLDELVDALPKAERLHWRPVQIEHVVCDSRQVAPGDLFVAISGVSVDGHRFVGDALQAGAVACVVERLLPELTGTPTVLVPNSREAFAYLHAALQGFPARQLRVIGVTGTDGKTTTVRLISAILRAAGHATGSVDSVSAFIGGQEMPTGFHTTTPDAPEVQAYLAEMVSRGMEYAVLETTSHGLAQHRVAACEFDVAVITNITHEHLDYHKTYEAYREAKGLLFRALGRSLRKPGVKKVAVLNADDPSYDYLRAFPADLHISYGLRRTAQVRPEEIHEGPSGLSLVVSLGGRILSLFSPLIGRYNVYNILAAVSVGYALELPMEAIRQGISAMRGVPGRMERIDRGQPFTVIVDFAHTPNALENALRTARQLARGKVSVVFGCAGLRDRAKRPWMGRIAGQLADRVFITAEDPRTEPLEQIIEEIAQGCLQAGCQEGQDFWRVPDRAEAIAQALSMAQPGDVVIVTGKGHERSMCFGTVEHPWSDHEAILQGLRALGYSG